MIKIDQKWWIGVNPRPRVLNASLLALALAFFFCESGGGDVKHAKNTLRLLWSHSGPAPWR